MLPVVLGGAEGANVSQPRTNYQQGGASDNCSNRHSSWIYSSQLVTRIYGIDVLAWQSILDSLLFRQFVRKANFHGTQKVVPIIAKISRQF